MDHEIPQEIDLHDIVSHDEVAIDVQPLLFSGDADLFDLDERGIGEDVGYSFATPVAESGEIPKEILAATAASAVSLTVIIILLIIGLVLGLGIGLGLGAAVGVGVGIGVNACPSATVKTTSYGIPYCYSADVKFKEFNILGTGFFQGQDRDGKIVSNPTLKLQQQGFPSIPLNLTGIGPALCGTDNCQQMNTTGFNEEDLVFSNMGYAKPIFSIINKDGCLIETTSNFDVHSVKMGYTGFAPFCISSNPADVNYNPTVTLSGTGITFNPTNNLGRPVIEVGGDIYPITNFTGTCVTLTPTLRICEKIQIKLTGNTFPSYVDMVATISHTDGGQVCSAAGVISAVSHSQLTSHDAAPFCYATVGSTADITITGTGFFAGSKVFIQSGGTIHQASFFSFISSTSVIVKFSRIVQPGLWTFGVNNLGCSTTFPAVQLNFLPILFVVSVSPQAMSLTLTNVITVQTSGAGFNPAKAHVYLNGAIVRTYTPTTITNTNRFTFTINQGDLVASGTYSVHVESTVGCLSVLHPLASNTILVSGTSIGVSSVYPDILASSEITPVTIVGTGFNLYPFVYALPNGNTTNPIPLGGVFRVSTTQLTLDVAPLAAGLYDLMIVNRDGSSVIRSNAFLVQTSLRPWIRKMTPHSFRRVSRSGFLDGDNFVGPLQMQVTCANGLIYNATVDQVTSTRVVFTLDATLIPEGQYCTVIVKNDGGISSWSFHGLSVHNNRMSSSQTIYFATFRHYASSKMFNTRRGTKHMLTMGGLLSNDNPMPLTNTDFGVIAQWTGTLSATSSLDAEGRPPTTISGAAMEIVGEFVYLTAGVNGQQTWRAPILDYQVTPTILSHITTFTNSTGQSYMLSGNWYYGVTAVYGSLDSNDPNGESLVGSVYNVFIGFPATAGLNSGHSVTITWDSVPNAAGYRVYRTSTHSANPTTLNFLATSAGPSYEDFGGATTAQVPPRYIGKWSQIGTTLSPRGRCGSALVTQVGGNYNWYLGGGRPAINTMEFLNITVIPKAGVKDRETHTLGTWILSPRVMAGDTNRASERLGMIAITSYENSWITNGLTLIYAGPGENGGNYADEISAQFVGDNGQFIAALSTASITEAVDTGGIHSYCLFHFNNAIEIWAGQVNGGGGVTKIAGSQFESPPPQTVDNTPNTLSPGLINSRYRMACIQDAGHVFMVAGDSAVNQNTRGREVVVAMH